MKRNTLNWAGPALLSAAMLALTSCSTPEGTDQVAAIETPDGAVIVDTFTMTETVTGIDAAKRKLTLVSPNGSKSTYKCGPEVVNFAQIQIGDQVKAKLTEEVAVFIGSGAPPSAMAGTAVALAPIGAKPGGVMVDTEQVTAKVTAIDSKKHKVTLKFSDGTTKKVKVGKKVDLANVHVGDDVTVQVSEGLALSVEKP
jgi:hypothetical protein